MIIECFGIPGGGKSTLTKKLVEKEDFKTPPLYVNKFYVFLFALCHPIFVIRWITLLIRESTKTKTWKLFRFKLAVFLNTTGRIQYSLMKFSKEDKVVLDEGLAQRMLSLFESKQTVERYLKELKKMPCIEILVSTTNLDYQGVPNKVGTMRKRLGGQYAGQWVEVLGSNHRTLMEAFDNYKMSKFDYKWSETTDNFDNLLQFVDEPRLDNLLILTQRIDEDDQLFGFFINWAGEFAKQFGEVKIICLGKGEYKLPPNVEVLSLGKEEGLSRLGYIIRFYKYIFRERKNYDAVFVHQNQIYVILGGILWRLWNKKIGLWYAHGAVSVSLRIAERLAHKIFTSTVSGFRLKSRKVHVVGQGIDTNYFVQDYSKRDNEVFKIVSVGRISPVKDYETLLFAIENLNREDIEVDIIGGPGTPEQEEYFEELKQLVSQKGLEKLVNFIGPVSNKDILGYLQKADLYVNTSHTGSLDKAILEAMSAGTPVLTCNEALIEVLGEYKESLMFAKKDSKELSRMIVNIMNMNENDRSALGQSLRQIVVTNHNVESLISKIKKVYEQ